MITKDNYKNVEYKFFVVTVINVILSSILYFVFKVLHIPIRNFGASFLCTCLGAVTMLLIYKMKFDQFAKAWKTIFRITLIIDIIFFIGAIACIFLVNLDMIFDCIYWVSYILVYIGYMFETKYSVDETKQEDK